MSTTMFSPPPFRIDMLLTDQRVYEALEKLLNGLEGQVSYPAIAKEVGCHENTVKRATRRLAHAGRLEMAGGKGRRPVIYRLKDSNAN